MKESVVLSSTYQAEVDKTVASLRRGFVILYPTDTIWGLGCDITNASAVKRVYEIKNRPENKPMVVLMSSIEMLREYIHFVHPRVETLLSHHRQPLTLIYDNVIGLPDHVMSDQDTCAIRICSDPFCQAVIDKFGKPIISTSANLANDPYPKTFESINPIIKEESDYIVSIRQEEQKEALPSIVARYNRKGELEFLRK